MATVLQRVTRICASRTVLRSAPSPRRSQLAETGAVIHDLQRRAGNHATARLLRAGQRGIHLQRAAASPVDASDQMLSIGMMGPAVEALQRALNLVGFGPLVEDGIFGPLTRDAVIGFQDARELAPDGVVGPQTKRALLVEVPPQEPAAAVGTEPAAIVGKPAPGGLNDSCAYLPGEKDRTASDPGGGSVSSLVAGAEPNQFAIFGFTQGSFDLKPAHRDFLKQMIARFELAGDAPKHRVRLIEGFSDCVDSFAKNVSIRRGRATATKLELLNVDSKVRSTTVGDAVASQGVRDQRQFSSDPAEAEEGRRQNRAAVCHVELVGTPKEVPGPEIPNQDTSCDQIHDKFRVHPGGTFAVKVPLGSDRLGAGLAGFGVVNCKTRCIHPARFAGGGFSLGVLAIQPDPTAPIVNVTAKEPVHTEELSAPAKLTITRVGPPFLNIVKSKLEITAGPITGTVIDMGQVKLLMPFKFVAGRFELAGRFTVERAFPSEIGGVKIVPLPGVTDCAHDPTQTP